MTGPLRIEVFECRGSAYEVGRQLAQQFLETPRGRAFRRRRERRPLAFSLADARHALERWAPNVWEELNGLAEGLAIPLERAVAEFSNGRLRYPRRGCSAVMSGGIYARNYDFDLRRYDRTLIAARAAGAYASIGFAERFTGRLDGMNEEGLCVGLHFVDEETWQPGLVCMLVVRMVLDQCATTREAIDLLRRLPHGLGFNYSLLDAAGEAAVVEASPAGVAVRQGEWLACTNHYQSRELREANPPGFGRSVDRLARLEAWAQQRLAADGLYAAFNASTSPAFHHGYARGFATLHTIVCEPSERVLRIGVGADAGPVRIDLGAWSRGGQLGLDRLEGRLGEKREPARRERRAASGQAQDRSFADADLAGASFSNVSLAGARFANVGLADARFTDVSLASARFDDIDFSGAEITANCNFRGMRIAGVPVEELFAAWREKRSRDAG